MSDGEKTIRCICPKCGRKHKRALFWSGRGVPKKFCNNCAPIVQDIERFSVRSFLLNNGARRETEPTG